MPEVKRNTVRRAEIIAALSLATDLGLGQPMEHALRSCVLAVRLGELLGLTEDDLGRVYHLALLRHVGCTADSEVAAAALGDEIAAGHRLGPLAEGSPAELMSGIFRHIGEGNPPPRRARQVATAVLSLGRLFDTAEARCEVAQLMSRGLGFGPDIQGALLQAFERWNGKGFPKRIKGEELSLPIRVVQLAMAAETYHRLEGVDAAITMARKRSGKAYDPKIVERFCQEAPSLFAGLSGEATWEQVLAVEPGPRPQLSEGQLDEALRAMADFADLKSSYTAGHSRRVSALAEAAAKVCKLSEDEVRSVRRAGLVHDIGKVGISSGIWGKEGPLTEAEWERVRLHPYYTERILSRPSVFKQLGTLAGLHHERLDGSGYHRAANGDAQPVTARILQAVATYQTKIESRPHRPALSPDEAAELLEGEVHAGRLDGLAVSAVLASAGHRVPTARRGWPAGLSEREVEVLRWVAGGLTNRQIAERLIITEKTVGHHVQNVYAKIGTSTRAAATLFAMQHDLLTESSLS